jgi:N-acyl-D-amino-acid deacylase
MNEKEMAQMEVQYLIKDGTIVDGTGSPAYRGDVRVKHGRIAQIARELDLEGRERIIDASGCFVTPGVH